MSVFSLRRTRQRSNPGKKGDPPLSLPPGSTCKIEGMAAKKRTPTRRPAKYRQVIEGEVTVDEQDGVVVWDYLPEVSSKLPAHGFAAGGLVEAFLVNKRIRIIIEEL